MIHPNNKPGTSRGAARLALAVLCSAAAAGASATEYPHPDRLYGSGPLPVCDQGSFFVGGALKTTRYTSVPPAAVPQVLMVGQMYVSFQIPTKYRNYPLILISGGGHTGACLESTPDGREGWAPYALRHGIPTFIVDQSGRGRSGFDSSAILEGKAKFMDDDPSNDEEAAALIPNMLTFGPSAAWTSWFGHLVDPATGQPTGPGPANVLVDQLVPHGWSPLDPNPPSVHEPGVAPQFPIHTSTPPIYPDNLITLGEWGPPPAGPAEFYNLDYYRQIVPNSEQTLPTSRCDSCTPQVLTGGFAASQTWTTRNVAELIENLGKNYGGAVLATHSQSGPIGHHVVRILRERGALTSLKGLITVEGTSCSMPAAGITVEDFDKVPYMVLKGDYTATNASCTTTVNEIRARRLAGSGTAAVEYIKLDELPSADNAWPAPLSRPVMPGITHMMMLGSDEGYGYDHLDVMDVILSWSDKHIEKMAKEVNCPSTPPTSADITAKLREAVDLIKQRAAARH